MVRRCKALVGPLAMNGRIIILTRFYVFRRQGSLQFVARKTKPIRINHD